MSHPLDPIATSLAENNSQRSANVPNDDLVAPRAFKSTALTPSAENFMNAIDPRLLHAFDNDNNAGDWDIFGQVVDKPGRRFEDEAAIDQFLALDDMEPLDLNSNDMSLFPDQAVLHGFGSFYPAIEHRGGATSTLAPEPEPELEPEPEPEPELTPEPKGDDRAEKSCPAAPADAGTIVNAGNMLCDLDEDGNVDMARLQYCGQAIGDWERVHHHHHGREGSGDLSAGRTTTMSRFQCNPPPPNRFLALPRVSSSQVLSQVHAQHHAQFLLPQAIPQLTTPPQEFSQEFSQDFSQDFPQAPPEATSRLVTPSLRVKAAGSVAWQEIVPATGKIGPEAFQMPPFDHSVDGNEWERRARKIAVLTTSLRADMIGAQPRLKYQRTHQSQPKVMARPANYDELPREAREKLDAAIELTQRARKLYDRDRNNDAAKEVKKRNDAWKVDARGRMNALSMELKFWQVEAIRRGADGDEWDRVDQTLKDALTIRPKEWEDIDRKSKTDQQRENRRRFKQEARSKQVSEGASRPPRGSRRTPVSGSASNAGTGTSTGPPDAGTASR